MRRIIGYDICPYLHAMSDFGFAYPDPERKREGFYSKPHTHDAECYATKCTRRGRCLIAIFETRKR